MWIDFISKCIWIHKFLAQNRGQFYFLEWLYSRLILPIRILASRYSRHEKFHQPINFYHVPNFSQPSLSLSFSPFPFFLLFLSIWFQCDTCFSLFAMKHTHSRHIYIIHIYTYSQSRCVAKAQRSCKSKFHYVNFRWMPS